MARIPPAVSVFVDRAAALDGAAYPAIEDAHLDADEVAALHERRDPKLSASESSSLDAYVRERLRARSADLPQSGIGTISGAIGATNLAARVIWKRDTVAPEVFEIVVAPFRDAGVEVP
ncbi:hypothetical protein EXU48_17330 [Occultella glacieicola]|uniref:Uncharacterized protein n=1 Tax=Occultella glacieicola TaxID=2518684 RepID=A0ABY2E1K0_9MICO|nr:hypothetical protein [Occultella glacieicola]TDE90865.1 hypothetical protein EXU48_17330 [Occultella glacieicola]